MEISDKHKLVLKKATYEHHSAIWNIIQQAIEQRRLDGSAQWQDGYPNEQTIIDDINNEFGYTLLLENAVVAYAAVIFGEETSYNEIDGQWLSHGDYAVVHRVATSNAVKGKGVATQLFCLIEELCLQNKVFSIKVDTNFDNIPMLKILNKLQYSYCGEIVYCGAKRKAFEKILRKQ